jgi:hypothetical protein
VPEGQHDQGLHREGNGNRSHFPAWCREMGPVTESLRGEAVLGDLPVEREPGGELAEALPQEQAAAV